MTDFLLLDANSIGFAAQSMNKLTANGQETQAIYGFLRSIRVMCDENPTAEPIVFWDGRSWRYQNFDAYKDGREKDPKQAAERQKYKDQKPDIVRAMAALGIEQRLADNMEADDLIAMYSWDVHPHMHATIVSGDRDLVQLVKDNVDWLNPRRKEGDRLPKLLRVTTASFEEDTGYATPERFVSGKALLGDVSDNLAGVPGIGKKAAPLVVAAWPNIADMIKDVRLRKAAAIPPELSRFRQKIIDFASSEESQRNYLRNYQLMRLAPNFIPVPEGLKIVKQPYRPEVFKDICKRLGFVSILRDFDNWTRPFREREEQEKAA